MKKTNLFTALIAALLISNSVYAEEPAKTTDESSKITYQNETLKTIHQRKSVRNYIEKEVTKEQLETIIKAAMAAPTAINAQPWQFLVVTDKALKAKYAEGNRQAEMINKCSALVVVCGDKTIGNERSWAYWDQDCSAATENLLLAVESLGLGAVWTGIYPGEDRIKTVKERFALPDNVVPLCVILVGYPDGTDQPKDKWKPERIHWNKY
ncbi:MAG: nitroreductase family protein [Candidatus Riflebacteria bacterium]|jgi:nitroreductase|nr:nitroreductase family protein [Candidatus Riflebacteria bacterium]